MNKHTPGPWKVFNGGRVVSEHQECSTGIAQIFQMSDWAEGNVSLIGAAPDLLNALEELLSEYEDHRAQFGDDVLWQKFERVEVIEQARTAISKARGKTE